MGLRGRGTARRAHGLSGWLLLGSGLLAAVAAGRGQEDAGESLADDPSALVQLIEALETATLDGAQEAALLRDGFTQFLARMDAKDGPAAVGLAKAMHSRAGATWSAFCLEGALRRSAPSDPGGASALDAYTTADGVLTALLRGESLSEVDRLAVVQRRAILAAGFADFAGERASLGRALAMGGVDGAQILGLKALVAGRAPEAVRLFGLLLDRGEAPEACPWGLRGHALASLAALRGRR